MDSHGRLIEECLTISSAWSETIVFRIKPSTPDVLSLPTSAGFLTPFQSLRIPVTSVQSVNPATFHISINVDIAAYDESSAASDEEDTVTAELYWLNKPPRNYTSRIIICECMKEGEANSDIDADRRKDEYVQSKVHPPKGHILNLMIKNVSKDDPLTSGEKEVR